MCFIERGWKSALSKIVTTNCEALESSLSAWKNSIIYTENLETPLSQFSFKVVDDVVFVSDLSKLKEILQFSFSLSFTRLCRSLKRHEVSANEESERELKERRRTKQDENEN